MSAWVLSSHPDIFYDHIASFSDATQRLYEYIRRNGGEQRLSYEFSVTGPADKALWTCVVSGQ
jgi:hypothetical protein